MAACEMKPTDKKAFIGDVGKALVGAKGKQKYYKPADIRHAAQSCGYPIDVDCWAYCIFASPEDFQSLHETAGEVCDYAAMREEVLADRASGGTFSWSDLELSWLDWPDIDLSGLFDWFDLPG